ncbi:phosphatase PAP2 family protein [Halopiger djelfimassiliensis]|uniref:phosphatase PAP2 family protein n=1 Tax=Halopiger djelfimassiliensis TaxID=1293047 RepID=UPI000677C41E|nr:phosphatase PAP2 family protein [Halopiger djelfimassiliensis]
MFTEVLLRVVTVVVGLMLPVAIAVFVGRQRLATVRSEWKHRLRVCGPTIAVLLVVLALNRVMRQIGPGLSRDIGIHMTEVFYDLEGEFVLIFQTIQTSEVTSYFTFTYVYGYTFLLLFPVVAYFALSDTVPFRRLLVAYSFNYALGLVLYIFVIAYGPRNMMPELVGETMLYDTKPEYQHLTRQVNRNTNVFPSLHTSLSATVATFAYMTRSEYPKWFPVATALAVSVIVSTMYLGIHWGIDVVAGLLLAAVSVALSIKLVGRWSVSAGLETIGAVLRPPSDDPSTTDRE